MKRSVATFVENPLSDWANDDLLLSEETRAYFRANHPTLLPIFDWPQLRERFANFDNAAGPARRLSRRGGQRAVLVGFASLILVAITPLAHFLPHADAIHRALTVAAAVLAVSATVMGYSLLLIGKRKAEWLTNRYWTERLRQLQFQLIINNLQLASDTMREPAVHLPRWEGIRTRALIDFEARCVRPVTAAFKQVLDDEAEEEFWLNDHWRDQAETPHVSPELTELLEMIQTQRFVIQRRFADLKLNPGIYSSYSRSNLVSTISDILTIIILLATVVSGYFIVASSKIDSLEVVAISSIMQMASAVIILLRVMNDGLQFSSEYERYSWYRSAVEALSRRYNTDNLKEKINVLREMERLSYQEMRWFLTSFNSSRFIV